MEKILLNNLFSKNPWLMSKFDYVGIRLTQNVWRHSIEDTNFRQGPRFSIRMVIGIFCSDTETGAATPPGVMQKK